MRPPREIEDMVKEMSFAAGPEMDRRLRRDIAKRQETSQTVGKPAGEKPIWRILMNTKMARLGIAAVVVVAALAVGVERWTREAPKKVQAYSSEIRANTALDLDPDAALPLREARSEDFDVTWSAENGGSLKILPGSSVRIWRIKLIDPSWDAVIGWAFEHLAEIQESEATAVVPKKKTPFAAVLTSEGNLAVVKIGGPNKERAWLSWRVEKAVIPGYSPTQTLTLRCVDSQAGAGTDGAVDLDTGLVLSIPSDVLNMPAAEILGWLEQNGIDAIARKTDEGYGLSGVGLVFWTWSAGNWSSKAAVDLREDLLDDSFQPRRPLLYQKDQYQYVFPFKTREGSIGMLQMLAVDTVTQTVEFRYRLVENDPLEDADSAVEEDAESERLAQSLRRIMRFGLMAWKYAEDHDWQYADTIEQLEEYAEPFGQDFQWIFENVEYVGAGRVGQDPPKTLIAYDKTLLAAGKGTYAVFRDGHAEFIEPNRLSEYGIPTEP